MGHPAHSVRPTLGVHLHLYRRGSIYYWRRRVTAQSTGNYVLQFSSRTTDLHRTRMLARRLTAESDRMLDGFRQATLNPAVARKCLRHVISSELTRVTESRAIIHADRDTYPDADWAMATA